MAEKTIAQLESELKSISEKTKKSYDALNSRNGLYKRLGIAQQTLKKSGLLKGAKEEAQATIKSLKPEIQAAEIEYNSNQTQKNAINKQIKATKTAEKESKVKEISAKSATNLLQKSLDELATAELGINGYKGDTKYQDAYRKAQEAHNAAISAGINPIALPTPKIEVPPKVIKEPKDGQNNTAGTVDPEELTTFIKTISDPANASLLQDVQKDLKNNFKYTGPTDGKWSLGFQDYLGKIATARGQLPKIYQGAGLREFLVSKESGNLVGATGGAGGTGAYGTKVSPTISSETDAASIINYQFQSLLGRDATAGELKKLTNILNKSEEKNGEIVTTSKSGTKRKTGLNPSEFIAIQIKSMPEFSTKKAAKAELTTQSITNTIKANGLTISPEQVAAWTQEVQNGGDVRNIQNKIRQLATTGMPDNVKKLLDTGVDLMDVYSPYKQTMAAVLELDPSSIDFNDPALRSAIGPAGDMPLYDFQRQLRQDSRWQYTNNAREEVSNSVMGVLKDFGFMG
jgi:hypothetical protein